MLHNQCGVPEISEREAQGHLKRIYQDIKAVLKVPVVNFLFRTMAFYDKFLAVGWHQVRANMLTLRMEEAAESLRHPKVSASHPKVNWSEIYDAITLEKIRRIVFAFNYVNPKLLLIVSAWAESLGGRIISGSGPAREYMTPGIYPGLPPVELVSTDQAPVNIKYILMDIIEKHHVLDAASDFRALAKYPEFLSITWNSLRPFVGTDEYAALAADLKRRSIELAHQMPFPVTITRRMLEQMYSPAEIAGIMGIVSMFQDFIPALIIDGEFFRKSLAGGLPKEVESSVSSFAL
jgi:hypothetical protein